MPFLFLPLAAAIVLAAPPDSGIKQTLDQSAVAWNHHDIEGFMTSYEKAPTTLYVGSTGIARGWDAIRTHYRMEYPPDDAHMGTLSFSDLEVHPLSPEYAMAIGRYHLLLAGGKTATGMFTLVMHRTAGGWRIAIDHSS